MDRVRLPDQALFGSCFCTRRNEWHDEQATPLLNDKAFFGQAMKDPVDVNRGQTHDIGYFDLA
jgi:hypothetical protein